MQLLAAHLILVAAAIGLAVLFGLRALVHFSRDGGGGNLALAAASLVVAGVLLVYFRKVRVRWIEARRAPHR